MDKNCSYIGTQDLEYILLMNLIIKIPQIQEPAGGSQDHEEPGSPNQYPAHQQLSRAVQPWGYQGNWKPGRAVMDINSAAILT